MRTILWLWPVLPLMAACNPVREPIEDTAAATSSADAGIGKHWLLTVRVSPTGFTVEHARLLDGPARTTRGGAAPTWRATLEDAQGNELQQVPIEAPRGRRGEWAGPDGHFQAVAGASPESVLTLRIPANPRATHLRLLAPGQHAPADLGRRPLVETKR